jgi:serine/threonine-protein phosphatase PGAM5
MQAAVRASQHGDIKNRFGPKYRTLVLVRHGEFSLPSKGLTQLGRNQAARTGRRLRHLPFARIHCSTMKRAYETALIIAKHHGDRSPLRAHLLRECLPSMPLDHRKGLPANSTEMIRRGKDQADRAYRRYFRKPAKHDECELLVSHGNVIRYLVGRVLGLGKYGWYQLGTSHCGITVIRISNEGDYILDRYNDTGHLRTKLCGPA